MSEEWLASPALPEDIQRKAVRFLIRHCVLYINKLGQI